MKRDVELRCRCGEVHGWVRDASPETVNRVTCLCDDCQAYLHHLGRADLLDANGGTEIVQVAPSTVSYERGTDRIQGVRLKPKGLHRFYATCCKTPLGNCVTPAVPFIGIAHEAFGSASLDEVFGPSRGAIFGKFAIGEPPPGSKRPNLRMLARSVRLVLGWRVRGKAWPHPFFDKASGAVRYRETTLTREERDALRPLCGPRRAPAGA